MGLLVALALRLSLDHLNVGVGESQRILNRPSPVFPVRLC